MGSASSRSNRSSPPISASCSPGWPSKTTSPSGSPATPISTWKRKRPTICWPPSSWRCAVDETYVHEAPIDLGGLWAVRDLDLPEASYEDFQPVTQRALQPAEGGTVD